MFDTQQIAQAARERLAACHARMTREEIAEHALGLVAALAVIDQHQIALGRFIENIETSRVAASAASNKFLEGARSAHEAARRGSKLIPRQWLADVARGEYLDQDLITDVPIIRADMALFEPHLERLTDG